MQIAGVSTSKDLDTEGFEALVGFFERLGFKPLVARVASFGARAGMASFAQIELIRTLWSEYIQIRIDRMMFMEIATEVTAYFPPERHVQQSAIHNWWQRNRPKSDPPPSQILPDGPGWSADF